LVTSGIVFGVRKVAAVAIKSGASDVAPSGARG
jgi:hypothetical protein